MKRRLLPVLTPAGMISARVSAHNSFLSTQGSKELTKATTVIEAWQKDVDARSVICYADGVRDGTHDVLAAAAGVRSLAHDDWISVSTSQTQVDMPNEVSSSPSSQQQTAQHQTRVEAEPRGKNAASVPTPRISSLRLTLAADLAVLVSHKLKVWDLGPFLQGFLMEQIYPSYARYLHGLPFNPYSQHLAIETGKPVWTQIA